MKSELAAGKPERRLTVRECAMIQTFPPDYEFVIKRDSVRLTQSGAYKIIGNAVPPVLAYKIARRLEDVWDKIFEKEK
jgi:DNA (cytosine-5)-methyltransferase 1